MNTQQVQPLELPIFYCLSVRGSDRRARMLDRFSFQNLEFEFQDVIPIDSPLIDYYLKDRPEKNNEHGRRLASMTIGWLSMIKNFISTGKPYGIFCEDDIHLRKGLKQDMPKIISTIDQLKVKPKIVLLGYLSILKDLPFPEYQGGLGFIKCLNGKYKLLEYPDDVWGAQMLLLSRDNAMNLLEKYDRPFHLSFIGKSFAGDCSFVKDQPRCLLTPMLAVEEGLVTTTDPGQIQFHKLCHDINFNKDEYY